jgi:hypothetical protein
MMTDNKKFSGPVMDWSWGKWEEVGNITQKVGCAFNIM